MDDVQYWKTRIGRLPPDTFDEALDAYMFGQTNLTEKQIVGILEVIRPGLNNIEMLHEVQILKTERKLNMMDKESRV